MIKLITNLLFRWEEVLVTDNMEIYLKIKKILFNNNIKTKSEIVNSYKSSHARNISSGRNNRAMYYLFVKKDELYQAQAIVDKEKLY